MYIADVMCACVFCSFCIKIQKYLLIVTPGSSVCEVETQGMSHQNEDVLHASLVELFHHLWEVPKSPGVKSENPALICIIQIIPLHILMLKKVE